MDAGNSWQLAEFDELRELGVGGGGRVVLARHRPTGTEVAIKYLAPWLVGAPERLDAFRSEAELMAGLVDEHLVTLYEYVETDSGAAIAMELIDGVALRSVLDEGGPLAPEAALLIMKGSLLGLATLHERGVVHRDYKPENVMVDGGGETKLVDYGIAAPVGEKAGVSGTPRYMAPEQWAGEPSTAASDVYAATATFVEALTGHHVFAGRTVGELQMQHLTAAPNLDRVPDGVRPLAEAGLTKEPGARTGDARRLLAQLETVAGVTYGSDWEQTGRHHLVRRVAVLALLFPRNRSRVRQQGHVRTDLGGQPTVVPEPRLAAAAPGHAADRDGDGDAGHGADAPRRRRHSVWPAAAAALVLIAAGAGAGAATRAGASSATTATAFSALPATDVAAAPPENAMPGPKPSATPSPAPKSSPGASTTVPTPADGATAAPPAAPSPDAPTTTAAPPKGTGPVAPASPPVGPPVSEKPVIEAPPVPTVPPKGVPTQDPPAPPPTVPPRTVPSPIVPTLGVPPRTIPPIVIPPIVIPPRLPPASPPAVPR